METIPDDPVVKKFLLDDFVLPPREEFSFPYYHFHVRKIREGLANYTAKAFAEYEAKMPELSTTRAAKRSHSLEAENNPDVATKIRKCSRVVDPRRKVRDPNSVYYARFQAEHASETSSSDSEPSPVREFAASAPTTVIPVAARRIDSQPRLITPKTIIPPDVLRAKIMSRPHTSEASTSKPQNAARISTHDRLSQKYGDGSEYVNLVKSLNHMEPWSETRRIEIRKNLMDYMLDWKILIERDAHWCIDRDNLYRRKKELESQQDSLKSQVKNMEQQMQDISTAIKSSQQRTAITQQQITRTQQDVQNLTSRLNSYQQAAADRDLLADRVAAKREEKAKLIEEHGEISKKAERLKLTKAKNLELQQEIEKLRKARDVLEKDKAQKKFSLEMVSKAVVQTFVNDSGNATNKFATTLKAMNPELALNRSRGKSSSSTSPVSVSPSPVKPLIACALRIRNREFPEQQCAIVRQHATGLSPSILRDPKVLESWTR